MMLLKNVFRMGRVLATGFCFVVFMGWGFSLGIVVAPLIRLFTRDVRRSRERFLAHMGWTWRVFVRLMVGLRAFGRIEVQGMERFPQDTACLIIANHITLVDIVVIGSRVRHFNCVVKTGLWHHRWFGTVVRACGFVPNVGSEDFIALCQDGFNEQRPLVVFPQGSRDSSEGPISFQRGAAQIAARTGVPVIPLLVSCKPPMLQKGVPWYKVPVDSPSLVMQFHDALEIPADIANEKSMPSKVRALNGFFESYFRRELQNWK